MKTLKRETAGISQTYPERIVQFGAGNFLRGFVDWIIQTLNDETDFASSIVVVKVTPDGKYESLDTQEGLFHVHLEGIENSQPVLNTKLITCINRTVYPYEDYDSYLALARQPEIRFLISNTTEAGISYREEDKVSASPPLSFPAKLTLFLYERFKHFSGAADKGCIIIPTELVIDNGTQLREMILRYAEQWGLETEFSQWIEAHNLFCNTLVDRIVSGFPKEKSVALFEKIGFEDALLTMGEPYHLWVIEAPQHLKLEFPVDKTNLNVKIVDDVSPYRQTKVRILNGLHTSMVAIGYLLGLEAVLDVMNHPRLAQFLQDEAYLEIIPSMDLPQAELAQFAADVFDRFRNPSIHHRLLSISVNSSAKLKTRILPSIQAYYEKTGKIPPRLVFAFAAFLRFYKGEWQGATIPLSDDAAIVTWFTETWRDSGSLEDVANRLLQNESFWESDLRSIKGLQAQVTHYLQEIEENGILGILEEINGQNS